MKNFKAHILIVDDDDRIRDLVKEYLNQNNYLVSTAKDSNDAFEKTKVIKFDLIVLDIMMPEMDGFQVLREIRQNSTIPIIMLTARGEVEDRIVGLELGADDYMPKPFEPEELTARIQSIMRRIKSPETMIDNLEFEHLSIDKLKQEVVSNGSPVSLSTTEFEAQIGRAHV